MKWWLYLIILCSIPLTAKVVEIDDIGTLIDYVDENSLLVFDVDNTLIIPKQYYGSTRWGWSVVSRLEKQGLSHEQAMEEAARQFHKVWQVCEVVPVDQQIPALITHFQEVGVPVVAITSRNRRLEFITLDQLNSVGIDVDLIVTGNKGEALANYCTSSGCTRVIFVDDQMKNLRRAETALRRSDSEYTGVWYRGAEEWIEGYSQELADLSERYFQTILSDRDAEKLIQAGEGQ